MTHLGLGLGLLAALSVPAHAQSTEEPTAVEEPPAEESEEDPLSRHRLRFDVLAERTIGTVSKPVAFNWRRTDVHLAAVGDFPFELNNFGSLGGGGMVRLPTGGSLVELGLTYAGVWDTPSSRR